MAEKTPVFKRSSLSATCNFFSTTCYITNLYANIANRILQQETVHFEPTRKDKTVMVAKSKANYKVSVQSFILVTEEFNNESLN